jgi:hypothetical protein
MLRSRGRLGLQGIALLPGELRSPAGVTSDGVRPADFRASAGSALNANETTPWISCPRSQSQRIVNEPEAAQVADARLRLLPRPR